MRRRSRALLALALACVCTLAHAQLTQFFGTGCRTPGSDGQICSQPEFTPFRYDVTENACVDFAFWQVARCRCFAGGTGGGPGGVCEGATPLTESRFESGAVCYDAATFNAAQTTARFGGWQPLGSFFPAGMSCGSQRPVRAVNGLEVSGFGIIATEGTQTSGQPYSRPTWLVATRDRDARCPQGYAERPLGSGELECVRAKVDACARAGNPALIATGEKVHAETDYRGRGPHPLAFDRHYASSGFFWPSFAGARPLEGLGHWWRHTYDRRLWIAPAGANILALAQRPDNQIKSFDAAGLEMDGCERSLDRLERAGEGWRYVTAPGDAVETYDANGRLVSIADRAGVTQRLIYSDASTVAADPQNVPRPGLLVAVLHPSGRALRLAYDAQGRITRVTEPGGGQWRYAYDDAGNLASVTGPDGARRVYHYNEPELTDAGRLPNALTGITDERGVRFASYRYNARGQVLATEHAGGVGRFALDYGNNSGKTGVTDPLGTRRDWVFTLARGMWRPGRIDGPACPGCSRESTYDARGNLASRTDWRGVVTAFEYDPVRNLEVKRTEAQGTPEARITSTEWHPLFRLPTRVAEPRRITVNEYDADGSTCGARGALCSRTVIPTTDPNGAAGLGATPDPDAGPARTWRTRYDAQGQPVRVEGPRGEITLLSYDASGNLAEIVDPLGQRTRIAAYDAHGNPLEIVTASGLTVTVAYDARHRPIERNAGGERTAFAYDAAGLLIRLTRPDGTFVAYTYDDAQRLVAIADAPGSRMQYTLDAMGNRTAETLLDAQGRVLRTRANTFDALARLAETANGTGDRTRFAYDAEGNPTAITDALGAITAQAFDALGRVTEAVDAAGGRTRMAYDGLGQMLALADPRGVTTTFAIDGLSNLLTESSPDAGQSRHIVDPAGNVTRRVDARGYTTDVTTDALGRPIEERTPIGRFLSLVTRMTYDPNGALTSVIESDRRSIVQTIWTRDAQGRALAKTQNVGATTLAQLYRYDAAGRLSTTILPSGRTLAYLYGADGRIAAITLDGAPLVSEVRWYPFGGPLASLRWASGAVYERGFDAEGRIVRHSLAASTRTLTYDPAGRITAIEDASTPGLAKRYAYDALGRLTGFEGYPGRQSFAYDAGGNRIVQAGDAGTYTHEIAPDSNRLKYRAGPGASGYLDYDAMGNTTAAPGWRAAYDARGRMASLSGAQGTVNYVVNRLGQRVQKSGPASVVPSGGQIYAYDEAGHLVGEYDLSRRLVPRLEYVYLEDVPIVALVGPAAQTEILQVWVDHLDTPRVLTDDQGRERWRWESAPFGETPADEDPSRIGKPVVFNLRFPGQVFDREAGLHYNYFRDYDPASGRYVQSDPIGLGGGSNTYAYVGLNPVSSFDPTGQVAIAADVIVGGTVLLVGCALTTGCSQTIGTVVSGLGNLNLAKPFVNDPQAQAEHDAYKSRSLERPPPNLDECERLKWLLKREQDVVQAMMAWDAKWLPGRHNVAIGERMRGIDRLKEQIKKKCEGCE